MVMLFCIRKKKKETLALRVTGTQLDSVVPYHSLKNMNAMRKQFGLTHILYIFSEK